jgi:hypothetical protein
MRKKFLFWNLGKKNLSHLVIELVKQESIDVVVLAETQSVDQIYLEKELSKLPTGPYKSRYISGQKIMLFDNLAAIRTINEDARASSCLYWINNQEILLVGVHLRSKKGNDTDDLYDLAGQHRQLIDSYGKKKVIVLGDFNMNPYEKGIMGVTGFNAILSKEEIRYNPTRSFGYMKRSFYYNPSWEVYNSLSQKGTYHFSQNTKAVNPYWHLLDQVLVSSDLMDSYVFRSFNVITNIGGHGGTELLKKEKSKTTKIERLVPNRSKFSDHLPITFEMLF